MKPKTRVSILDDHQSIIDGYRYRLQRSPEIEVVATGLFGHELESMLEHHPTDVLLLDLQIATAPDNANPYEVLRVIPHLLQTYPTLSILIISMHVTRTLVRSVMEKGASGYILKDDHKTIQRLAEIIFSVAQGDIYLSREAEEKYAGYEEKPLLTTRQLEVLSLFAAYPDHTSASVALKLNVANSTVRNLLSDAYLRLGVRNRGAAILKAQQLGILPPPPTHAPFV